MERLTTDKKATEMGMYELAHNCCYIKDGLSRYRDFEIDMDARDFARNLMTTLANEDMSLDDELFDEEIMENLTYDQFSDVKGLIALFYRNLWAMSDLREHLKSYEDAEENGMLKHLPCRVGDTVYVLWKCGQISPQLDGTLYGENGGPGTATGYYCPYEDNCPHADYSCEECESKTAVFEDTVVAIWLTEEGIFINTENCGACSALGEICFLTREAAEQALKQMGE